MLQSTVYATVHRALHNECLQSMLACEGACSWHRSTAEFLRDVIKIADRIAGLFTDFVVRQHGIIRIAAAAVGASMTPNPLVLQWPDPEAIEAADEAIPPQRGGGGVRTSPE